MNRRFFNLLGIVVALLLVAVLALNWLGPQKPEALDREKMLPELAAERGLVDHIQLGTRATSLVTLQRHGEQWQVVNRDGYVANAGKVRSLLDQLSSAEKSEAKTADPARHEKLGLLEDSDTTLLLTLRAGDRIVADLVVGKSVTRPPGHYVRIKGEAQSWLIDRELTVSREVTDWLRTDLINLPASKIRLVERLNALPVQCITAPCPPVPGERLFALSKAKAEDNSFSLAPIPAGKEPGAAWLLSGLSDALNGLAATDVVKATAFDFASAKATLSRYVSFDDQIVLVSHYLLNNKHYVGLHAEAGPAATDAVKKSVEELNQRHAGWLYEVSSYKGEGMARELNDLVQNKVQNNKSVN